jgi:hypothetical protein
MKRTYFLLGLAVFLLAAIPAQGQDDYSPQEQLDFARKLRDKGYVDLAVEYLEAMRQNPAAASQPALLFELGKTRLMLAGQLDPEDRLGSIEETKTQMEEFLRKHGNTPEAALVRKDLNQITGDQARAMLSLALRLRGVDAQQSSARQAETYFIQTAAALETSIKGSAAEIERRQARFDLAVIKMEQARCYVKVADEQIMKDRSKIVGQARKMFDELAKLDDRIGLSSRAWLIKCCSEDEGSDPLVADKCFDELRKHLDQCEKLLTKARGKPDEATRQRNFQDAKEASRLARYFQMVRIPRVQTDKELSKLDRLGRYKKVESEAEAWLKAFPAHARSPIGYGVRYELANALFNEALLTTKDEKLRTALYARAQDILDRLNEPDNDLVGKVGELRAEIARGHLRGKTDASIGSLATFELCQLRAGIENDRIQNLGRQIEETNDDVKAKRQALSKLAKEIAAADAAEKKKLETKLKESEKALKDVEKRAADLDKKVREHLRITIEALNRALLLADKSRTPRYAIDNVRFDLLAAYSQLESAARTRTPYRLAVIGEAIAKANPPSKHAPLALEQAISAWERIVSVDPSPGNHQRLRDLALFALSPERAKLWEKEKIIGVAHYSLAMLDQNEARQLFARADRNKESQELLQSARAKLQDAMAHLSLLPRDGPADLNRYYYAQGKAVFLVLEARDKVAFPKEKEFYRDLARKIIKEMPTLSEGIKPFALEKYFMARMEESKFLYEEGAQLANQQQSAQATQKYQELTAFLDGIDRELAGPAVKNIEAGLKDPDQRRDLADVMDQLHYYIGTMRKYAGLGRADLEYKAGAYEKVLQPDMTGKVVDFVKKEAEKNPVIRLKEFQITGQIVGLALRANIQLGRIDEATKLLKILQNLSGVKDNALVDTSAVLRGLVGELDTQIHGFRRMGDQEKVKLKRTQENFTLFLDALVKQGDKSLERKDLFFLARCYDILDQHDKAATIYGQYPRPANLDVAKKEKEVFTDDEERELQSYCYAQVMLARQLRLSKKPVEAKKILDAVAGFKNARQLLQVEREQICLLEDGGLYGTAITRWSTFMNAPALKNDLAVDRERKKIYFDAYYHLAFSYYKYSQLDKVKAAGKEAQYLTKAADYIVRLESIAEKSPEGWQEIGHRFEELMRNEKTLHEAYLKQKGG